MKKLLIFAVMAAMGFSAQAQLMRSTTFYEKERVPATWYLRAGMSINNVAGANTFSEETDGSIGSKIGYDVAVGFQKSIKDRGFYWGMEFGLGTGGAKNEMETESSYVYKQSYVAHNIKLTPLLFGYKYAFSDVMSLDVHLGAFAQFAYAGKYNVSGSHDDEEWSEDYGVDDALDTRFDAGIQAGVGVWFSRFNIDLTYQRGFVPIDPTMFNEVYRPGSYSSLSWWSNCDGKSSNLILRVGVSF